mgnify:CR=1 FL=1
MTTATPGNYFEYKNLVKLGAILEGHFVLTSGRHSAHYFEKFRILENAPLVSSVCDYLVQCNTENNIQIDCVIGPLTGGALLSFEMGRRLIVPSLYAESDGSTKVLRRGMTIPKGANVLVIDDVYTTGKSIQQVIDIVITHEAKVSAVNCIINRSDNQNPFGVPLFSAFDLYFKTYAADAVPSWLKQIPITKTK